VDENLTVWDKNTDNPGIRVRMVLYATSGLGCGLIFNCDAEFRMYYAGQDDPTFNSTATFPIMNESAAEEILGNDDPADDEETPGFGIIAGAGALGLAAAWASRRDD
jgi:MYXO-CTERM domain-containing protein